MAIADIALRGPLWRCAVHSAGAPAHAASPTAHWLEYMDWAEPFLAKAVTIENDMAAVPDAPGTGVHWDEDAVKRFTLSP